MGTAAGCAAAEIECRQPLLRRALHERPVEQHVRRERVVLRKRGGPGHFELAMTAEPASGGNGPRALIRTTEPHVIGEGLVQRFEQATRLRGSPEIPHVLREYAEERTN